MRFNSWLHLTFLGQAYMHGARHYRFICHLCTIVEKGYLQKEYKKNNSRFSEDKKELRKILTNFSSGDCAGRGPAWSPHGVLPPSWLRNEGKPALALESGQFRRIVFNIFPVFQIRFMFIRIQIHGYVSWKNGSDSKRKNTNFKTFCSFFYYCYFINL